MRRLHIYWRPAALLLLGFLFKPAAEGAEGPFFVTYTHQLEEPGNLEMGFKNVMGSPQGANLFLGNSNEFEYGVAGWWTTELYLDTQATSGQGGLWTGWRFENRFRPLMREHWINPVLYVEWEDTNAADKSLLEVVGHDGLDDLAVANREARQQKQRELETKLILSSFAKGWTIAENLIAEKNIAHEPWEFGYAAGVSRPLAMKARPGRCNLCPENFALGVEAYGGLGTWSDFGLHQTSHYIAPTLAWTLDNGTRLSLSPSFGLTGQSAGFLMRFGVSYEIQQFGRKKGEAQ